MKISELPKATNLGGSELLEIVQDGVSKQITLADLAAAQPDANGIYPDVPFNRVEIRRLSGQSSTIPAIAGNVSMFDKIAALCAPVLTDSNSKIVAYLNGNNVTKTADGLNATLSDPTLQAMTRIGGFWHKYEYEASTNTKISKFSIYKVRGYRYVRRRFIGMYGAALVDGKLVSNADRWSKQSLQMHQYHTYAKETGEHYREIAMQDYEVYRWLFFLLKQTYNSQSVYAGATQVDYNWWNKFGKDGGTTGNFGQFGKTGYLNDILGHEGEKSITASNSEGISKTVKPCKFLWCEDLLAGPFWVWMTGRIHKDGVWYEFKDLSKIAFSVNADATPVCDVVNKGTAVGAGYILECFEDTMIPTQIGGSTSTGMCDGTWTATAAGTVYVPAGVGAAGNGSLCGVSVLISDDVPSNSNPHFGGCLASDDPTDTTADGAIAA